MLGWNLVLWMLSRGLLLTKRDLVAWGGVSKVTNQNISRHIQYIKLQSVSPLIGNKCKCLVMPGLGAMKNTSGWLVFLPTICCQNERGECMRVCAPEEGDSGKRGSGSRNGGGGRGLLERGRSVLEGSFWPELFPTHGDLQGLHPCLVLRSRPGQHCRQRHGPCPLELPTQYACVHQGGKQSWWAPGALLLAISYH